MSLSKPKLYWGKDKSLKGTLTRTGGEASLENAGLTFSIGKDYESEPISVVTNVALSLNTADKLEFTLSLNGSEIAEALSTERKYILKWQLDVVAAGSAPVIHQGEIPLLPAF